MPEIESISKISMDRAPGELLTPMKAIRSKCLDCCCGSAKEAALCTVTSCPLWPYRFGSGKRARRIVAQDGTCGLHSPRTTPPEHPLSKAGHSALHGIKSKK